MFLASSFALLALAVSPHPAPLPALAAVQTPVKMEDLFPPPKEGLTITVDRNSDKTMKLDAVVEEFSRVTGIAIQAPKDTQSTLRAVPTGLNRTVVVPPSEVYRIFETLLIANDFVLVHLSDAEPRIWRIQSLQGGPQVRQDATFIRESELELWAKHPATLVTVSLSLAHTDVRTLSNSMRTMFTDANTQQIIPIGSNSLIVTGFAPNVAAIARLLHAVDDLERARASGNDANTKPVPTAK